MRGRGFRRCCLGRPWLLIRLQDMLGARRAFDAGYALTRVLKLYFAHTHKRTHTHTHIRVHKHTCRKAAEVCFHRKENIR